MCVLYIVNRYCFARTCIGVGNGQSILEITQYNICIILMAFFDARNAINRKAVSEICLDDTFDFKAFIADPASCIHKHDTIEREYKFNRFHRDLQVVRLAEKSQKGQTKHAYP